MDNNSVFKSNYIAGMKLEEILGKYSLSCVTGFYSDFNLMHLSNQPHFHNCFELMIITYGQGKFLHRNEVYNIQKSDVIIADPNTTHEITVNKNQSLQLINFFISVTQNHSSLHNNYQDQVIYSFLNEHKRIVPSQKHLLPYLSFIDEYCSLRKYNGFGAYQALKNLILEALDVLSTKSGNLSIVSTNSPNTLELALAYIDQNLNTRIIISEMAQKLCVSTRNLQYLFKKHIGKTIVDYINEKKMVLAAHYLMKQFTVSDTSSQLGFNDTSQFSRLFKKYIGLTPKKYQQFYVSKSQNFGRRNQDLDL